MIHNWESPECLRRGGPLGLCGDAGEEDDSWTRGCRRACDEGSKVTDIVISDSSITLVMDDVWAGGQGGYASLTQRSNNFK